MKKTLYPSRTSLRFRVLTVSAVLVLITAACGGSTPQASPTDSPDYKATVEMQATEIARLKSTAAAVAVELPTATPTLNAPLIATEQPAAFTAVVPTAVKDVPRYSFQLGPWLIYPVQLYVEPQDGSRPGYRYVQAVFFTEHMGSEPTSPVFHSSLPIASLPNKGDILGVSISIADTRGFTYLCTSQGWLNGRVYILPGTAYVWGTRCEIANTVTEAFLQIYGVYPGNTRNLLVSMPVFANRTSDELAKGFSASLNTRPYGLFNPGVFRMPLNRVGEEVKLGEVASVKLDSVQFDPATANWTFKLYVKNNGGRDLLLGSDTSGLNVQISSDAGFGLSSNIQHKERPGALPPGKEANWEFSLQAPVNNEAVLVVANTYFEFSQSNIVYKTDYALFRLR